MRLIDADSLKRKPEGYAEITMDWEVTVKLETILNKFLRWIDTEQTVDAEPVRHGRWITKEIYRCSVCDMLSMRKWPYCANCGARMDGDGDADN